MARLDEEFERRWHQEAEAVMSGMKEWRLQHPKATFREIEAAVDEKLSGMRARLLEDLALASRAADLQDKQLGEHPRCQECGHVLVSQGKQDRTVITHGGGEVHLRRDYARCSACGAGLFPPG
jgi:predicted Zn-ribbon and HTH transcriptional regulator